MAKSNWLKMCVFAMQIKDTFGCIFHHANSISLYNKGFTIFEIISNFRIIFFINLTWFDVLSSNDSDIYHRIQLMIIDNICTVNFIEMLSVKKK